jgi:hypothetical protein
MDLHVEKPELLEYGDIPVNERWRSEMLRYWRGAQAVVVQHMKNPEKRAGFNKIQRIKLQQRGSGEMPKCDLDDVLTVIAQSIYGWLDGENKKGNIEETEQVHFAIEIQRILSAKDMTRNKFYLTASLASAEDDPYDNPELEALSELERRQQMFMDAVQRENDALRIHVENLHGTLIQLATINVAPVKEAAKILEMAGQLQLTGAQAYIGAQALQYDAKKVEAEQREKTRRTEMWVQNVGQYVMPYVPAVGAWAVSKIMGKEAKDIPSPNVDYTRGHASETADDAEDPTDAMNRQWVEQLRKLYASLTPDQMASIAESLKRDELKLFLEILESETLVDAVIQYETLCTTLDDPSSLLGMIQRVFMPEQQQIMLSFHMAASQVLEHMKDAGSDDDASDDTDDAGIE